jgi:hypothetical protein
MPIVLPDSIPLKIERAEQLLREIDKVCNTYADSSPATLVAVASDLPPTEFGLVWGVKARILPSPPELRALVGDFIHNLRSVMEYLARALVISNGGTPIDEGGRKTQFPISSKNTAPDVTIAGGVDAGALAIVRSLQPGPTGIADRHPLSLLNFLSNEDKHHAPLVVAGGTAMPAAFVIRSSGVDPLGHISPLARWLLDGEWAVMPMFPILGTSEVIVESNVRAILSLPGEGPAMPALAEDLDYLLRFVRGSVLPQFEPFFAAPWPEGVLVPEAPIDPMVTARNSALGTLDQLSEAIEKMAASVPVSSDGRRRIVLHAVAEYINVDPRLLRY